MLDLTLKTQVLWLYSVSSDFPILQAVKNQSELRDKEVPTFTGKIAPQLRALAVLTEDLGLIPTTHMATHNQL